jgi:hypothetical protein
MSRIGFGANMQSERPDPVWMQWNEVQLSIALDIKRNDLDSALSKVDSFLATGERTPEIRSAALGMKAELQEDAGQLENAKQTLLVARDLVEPGLSKYVHEFCLAGVCRKQGQIEEAISWYRTALRTSIEGSGVSSGSALKAFLDVLREPRTLAVDDHDLCVQAIQRSWRILHLAGEPDATDLLRNVSTIREREGSGPKEPAAG